MSDRQLCKNNGELNIYFGGNSSIDVSLFAKVIEETAFLIKTSANLIDPNCFIRMEIKANREGSFQTLLGLVTEVPLDFFNSGANLAANTLGCFLYFFQIKHFLKGKAPQKVETKGNITEVTQDEEVLKVPAVPGEAFFRDCRIDRSIVNISVGISESDRDSFSLEANQEKFLVSSEDFDLMKVSIFDDPRIEKTLKQKPVSVQLQVKKPDLIGNSKWEFVLNGKIIKAEIQDEQFLYDVRKANIRKLYAGVSIPCLLEMEMKLDERDHPIFGSEAYTILEITGEPIEPEEHADMFGA